MVAEIRALDPKPASSFRVETVQSVTPDILMQSHPDGGWFLELNQETLPRVLVNTDYFARVSKGVRRKDEKEYVNERFQTANWLVKSLHQRATTILKVAGEIVKQQDAFFRHGVEHLKPLILRDIAEEIEMHESTVSRVTNGLMVATPKGTFPLKSLFSVTIETEDKENGKSAAAVRNMIKKILHEEKGEKPLSDDIVAKLVSKNGVKLARRTVAKYREMLNIPSSSERKRRAKLDAMTAS